MQPELFLSCDWGTTRFRLRLAEIETGRVHGEVAHELGVAKLSGSYPVEARPNAYRQVLQASIEELERECAPRLIDLPVVISGMASSSLGWYELPYAQLPFALSGENAVWRTVKLHSEDSVNQSVYLLSGVSSTEDVMRGEETELMGAWNVSWEYRSSNSCVAILPGTHSKHIEIRNQQVVSIRTYMTGELFDILCKNSVIKHSLPDQGSQGASASYLLTSTSWGDLEDRFLDGVTLGADRSLLNAIFMVRTRALLANFSPIECQAFFSGLLIGAELSELLRYAPGKMPILLCAGGNFSMQYRTAIDCLLKKSQKVFEVPAMQVKQIAVHGQAVLLKQILGTQ